jgi:hypothetical protein
VDNNTVEALVIEPGGEVRITQLQRGCEPLQKLVGGWIEAVYSIDQELTFWINEEGKLIGLVPNPFGTAVWHGTNPNAERVNDFLCGTVVVTGGVDDLGETLSIPATLRDMIIGALDGMESAL